MKKTNCASCTNNTYCGEVFGRFFNGFQVKEFELDITQCGGYGKHKLEKGEKKIEVVLSSKQYAKLKQVAKAEHKSWDVYFKEVIKWAIKQMSWQ